MRQPLSIIAIGIIFLALLGGPSCTCKRGRLDQRKSQLKRRRGKKLGKSAVTVTKGRKLTKPFEPARTRAPDIRGPMRKLLKATKELRRRVMANQPLGSAPKVLVAYAKQLPKRSDQDYQELHKEMIKSLKDIEQGDPRSGFGNVITTCINCHQKHASGSMTQLMKLSLTSKR